MPSGFKAVEDNQQFSFMNGVTLLGWRQATAFVSNDVVTLLPHALLCHSTGVCRYFELYILLVHQA